MSSRTCLPGRWRLGWWTTEERLEHSAMLAQPGEDVVQEHAQSAARFPAGCGGNPEVVRHIIRNVGGSVFRVAAERNAPARSFATQPRQFHERHAALAPTANVEQCAIMT